jgi:hypothetical protein
MKHFLRCTLIAILSISFLRLGTLVTFAVQGRAQEPCDTGYVSGPERTKSLSGFAGYTNTGTPVPGMILELFAKAWTEKIAETATDDKGRFRFAIEKPGRYFLLAHGKGLFTERIIVVLDEQGTKELCLVAEACADGQD